MLEEVAGTSFSIHQHTCSALLQLVSKGLSPNATTVDPEILKDMILLTFTQNKNEEERVLTSVYVLPEPMIQVHNLFGSWKPHSWSENVTEKGRQSIYCQTTYRLCKGAARSMSGSSSTDCPKPIPSSEELLLFLSFKNTHAFPAIWCHIFWSRAGGPVIFVAPLDHLHICGGDIHNLERVNTHPRPRSPAYEWPSVCPLLGLLDPTSGFPRKARHSGVQLAVDI